MRPDPDNPGLVNQGITVTAPDKEHLLNPGPALEHADWLLRQTDPSITGMWARTAARLTRLALERAVDRHWEQTRPELLKCNTRMRVLMLESALSRSAAREAFVLWSRLSDATHPHPYELAPTAAELRRWHNEVAAFISQLTAVDRRPVGRSE